MTTLEKILSQAVISSEAIRDRVTGNADKILSRSGGSTVQITAVGDFSKPWANAAEEIDAIRSGTWFPSTDDFIAFGVKSRASKGKRVLPIVGSTEAFIHLILDQKPKSISRINLITHGGVSSIGFLGDVIPGNVAFDDELDLGVLSGFLRDGLVYKGKQLQWSDVENRFADNAVFVIYGCKVGMSESFIQDVADFFGIRIQAFKHELKYHFPPNALSGGAIRRNLATVDGEHDFLNLIPEIDKTPLLKNPFE